MNKFPNYLNKLILPIVLIVLIVSSFLWNNKKLSDIQEDLINSDNVLKEIASTQTERIDNLEASFKLSAEQNISLNEALLIEKEKSDEIKNKLENIDSTVGDLEKLSDLDPDLLKKYSKVYFLNEHYEPVDLDKIPSDFVYNKERDLEIHSDVLPFLENLFEEAEKDGIDIKITSAYRSFGTQAGLKSSYNFTYGAGTANQFSADQGYSEHQLGTTLDFTTDSLSGGLGGFQNTEAYVWLKENAYRFGFVLSYPEGNSYYQYEPWHWRFVGRDLARKLDKDEVYFYDFDQRKIDEYLISIFD